MRQTTVISKQFLLGPGFTYLHKFLTFLRSPTYKGIFQNVAKITIINRLETGRPLEVKFFLPPTSILPFGLRPESFGGILVTFELFIPITKSRKNDERNLSAAAAVYFP